MRYGFQDFHSSRSYFSQRLRLLIEEMGYKGNYVKGEIPESGAIFMSNVETKDECLERKLFGLPSGMSNFVLHVKKGMTLFLFEFERRLLYGVFRATCDGEINIEPKAFRSSGKQFPAQVRFTTVWKYNPLAEHEFEDVIRDNYFTKKKFHFGLNEKQVSKLQKLFHSKENSKIHPERGIWRFDDKGVEGNTRFRDLRKNIRHRKKFDRCDFRCDEDKEVDDDNMYINKHIIDSRQRDKKEEFLTHYPAESDEFGDWGRHDILGKHFDFREKHIEDGYMSVFSKPHERHLEEIGVGSSDILMDGVNKDIIDYNRLQDGYNVAKGIQGSLNEHSLTNPEFSHFNQNAYSNCDRTRTDVSDIQLSPFSFDDGLSFIPIAENCPFYPSPEKIPRSESLPYYSHNERSYRYFDDLGSQSSIYPKFISRKLSPSDAGLRLHEVDPIHNDKRFHEKPEKKHACGTTDKRVSVFSRLSSTSRRTEQAFETDERHELNSSVDKVMKMLEKVVSSPIKRTGERSSVIKQGDDEDNGDDDDDDYNSADSKTEFYEFPGVKLDADVTYKKVEGESVFQETRLMDFKRRRKSNKRSIDTSKQSSEHLVGATSPSSVAIDRLTDMPHKRRKLVRPPFVEKNFIPHGVSAQENTLSENNNISKKVVLETSEQVDASIKLEDVSLESTSHENTPDDCNSTKARTESLKKADVSIKHIDLNMQPTFDDGSPSKDNNFTNDLLKSSEKANVSIKSTDNNILLTSDESSPPFNNSTKALLEHQKSGNKGYENAENCLVSDVFVEATRVASPKDDQKMCGWIEW